MLVVFCTVFRLLNKDIKILEDMFPQYEMPYLLAYNTQFFFIVCS
jgi:hypothetical protein